MDFIAKLNGPNPPAQDWVIAYKDCDTDTATTELPTTLTLSATAPWIILTMINPGLVRVSCIISGLAIGVYTGNGGARIPDPETCEVGRVLSIPINLTVQKRKVKFV